MNKIFKTTSQTYFVLFYIYSLCFYYYKNNDNKIMNKRNIFLKKTNTITKS